MTSTPEAQTAQKWVGQNIGRPDDHALLTGAAQFTADLAHPLLTDAAEVVFVGATVAHARLVSVDVTEARSAPGVLAVLTAADHSVIPAGSMIPAFYPSLYAKPLLAEIKVRYVGEPVVAIAAETRAQAIDAAELVAIEYDVLPAVIDLNDAATDDVLLFGPGERCRVRDSDEPTSHSNTVLLHEQPHDPTAFAAAPVRIREQFFNPRQSPSPMEPHRQACAWTADGDLHVWATTQRPHGFHEQLCDLYQLDPAHVHVTAPRAVGGGFGGKVSRTAEEHMLPEVSRQIGRPVRWTQTRGEYFQAATQGRGEQMDFELAGTEDGRILALRCEMLKDSGAYPGVGANLPGRFNALGVSGPYDIAHVEFRARSVVTNAPQVSAFRGAGRGPYLAALERLIDVYAADIGMDPAEVRLRNLVRPEQMPFTSVTGSVYDEADYPGDLQRVLATADYAALRAEQADLRATQATVQMGIGIASYHLMTVGGGAEEARVLVRPDGGATVFTGTTSQGHGHDATWAQIAADQLGMDISDVTVLEGSTAFTDTGVGAVGSRSMQTAGVAVRNASIGVVDQARQLAAQLLEAAPDDIVLQAALPGAPAHFHVAGVPSVGLGWKELALSLQRESQQELTCGDVHDVGTNNSFPSGAHIAVVDIDTETGEVRVRRFLGVDDVGQRVNPMIVEGQLHGGIASGIGQVLGECMVYDDDGNPLTTSFLSYQLPTTDVLPNFELETSVTPTSFNELGAKGVGESGVVGAVPAVHNAILDALAPLGVRRLDIPCTPERIWQAIQTAS